MKDFYLDRLKWIFTYRNNTFFYVLAKTLCLIVGVPVYAVLFIVEILSAVLFSLLRYIPVLNVVFQLVFMLLMAIASLGFLINVLPDLKEYQATHKREDAAQSEQTSCEYSFEEQSEDQAND